MSTMKTVMLSPGEILASYDAVSALYPFVPSLSHWRAWEHAAYRRYRLDGRVLDLGCGDGRYFRLLWPRATGVTGVDMDPGVAEAGRRSGVYESVHSVPAHELPLESGCMDAVFANCSLEHMDHLDRVLGEVNRCLVPGGRLLCSVVTDRFLEWATIPNLLEMAGHSATARSLEADFVDFHHLANAFPVQEWVRRLEGAGFEVEEHVPVLPRFNSGAFLLMDGLWHAKRGAQGEWGDVIHPFLAANAGFPLAFRKILEGLMDMETDRNDCSGAVFSVRKRT